MHKAAQAYFQTQVTTTSQGELLLLLYDGAIKFLTQAKERMAARDMAGKGVLISKALDVINELDGSLNAEKGGDLAGNLHKLYFYCSTRLLTANLKLDPNLIDEVIKILSGLRGAYAQIVNTPEAQAAAADVAARQSPAATAPQRSAPVLPNMAKPPAGFAARAQATAAYGQTAQPGAAIAPDAPVSVGSPLPPAPSHATSPAAPRAAQANGDIPRSAAPVVPGTSAASGGAQGHVPGLNGTGSTTATEATAQPETSTTAAQQLTGTPGGFANKRLNANNLYKKLAQG